MTLASSPAPRTKPRARPASARPVVAIVDYGAGNLVSIEQALTALGAEAKLVRAPDELSGAAALVVPGVGAAAPAMRRLRSRGLIDPIVAWVDAGRPYLGICLGLQLLFEVSDEDGARMLGLLPGRVERLRNAPRLPHIGWNQVELRSPHPLFEGIPSGTDLYFVHSYAPVPAGPAATAMVLAETEHGGRFTAAVARGRTVGVQFHPERSGRDGLRFLANFVSWAGVASGVVSGVA